VAATHSTILNPPSTGPGALLTVNPYADIEIAFLNFTSSFLVDDRAHLFAQALIVTLNSSLTWSEGDRFFALTVCTDFLTTIHFPSTPPLPNLPPYQLLVDVPDDKADFFAELLLRLPQTRRLQLLLHYLWRFYTDLPRYLVSDCQVVTTIYTSFLPHTQSSTRVLQRITPSPPLPPVGRTFGPLTLADTPLPAPITNSSQPLSTTPLPAPPIPKPAVPSAPVADSLLAPSTPPQAQTCQLIVGRCRHHPSSTWTLPCFKPPRPTLLLHHGIWSHAPWLDPLLIKFHSTSHARQAFLWLCLPWP